ncbi:hypothetical protein HGM15179_005036 [Zosterops borbonicus]|uniref:Interleukin-4 n=1 Tax=Zosterops borbonicus TaxID=364589 RepID=A0A8K1GQE8_9PASS|nr:hypothetical protein HGM15179_005036 [Zosterops borbonicus]
MSILVQVLLTFLVLSACLTPQVHTRRNKILRESIILLGQIQWKEPCVFSQGQNNTEIFCKAAKIAEQVKNCGLEGIYDNLLKLVQQRGAGNEGPCPVAAGSTTSLKNFLKELHQVLQNEYKYQK